MKDISTNLDKPESGRFPAERRIKEDGEKLCGSFGIGFLIGSAIGLAIGMLYAPYPGSEMRGAMKGKTVEAKQNAERIIEDAR